jgi:hypothetical protein
MYLVKEVDIAKQKGKRRGKPRRSKPEECEGMPYTISTAVL